MRHGPLAHCMWIFDVKESFSKNLRLNRIMDLEEWILIVKYFQFLLTISVSQNTWSTRTIVR